MTHRHATSWPRAALTRAHSITCRKLRRTTARALYPSTDVRSRRRSTTTPRPTCSMIACTPLRVVPTPPRPTTTPHRTSTMVLASTTPSAAQPVPRRTMTQQPRSATARAHSLSLAARTARPRTTLRWLTPYAAHCRSCRTLQTAASIPYSGACQSLPKISIRLPRWTMVCA